MWRADRFVEPEGEVICTLPSGRRIALPLAPGILKHPTVEDLRRLLTEPAVARKYTIAALHKAPWSVLRKFPRRWLEECMAEAELSARRAAALAFLLS